MYQAYHYPTANTFFFKRKPTIKDLIKLKVGDFEIFDFTIEKIKVIDNSLKSPPLKRKLVMPITSKSFYYIGNTCDHDLAEGEILVVLDDKKNVIWHHDWSDSYFDFPEHLPVDLMKNFGATYDSKFEELDETEVKSLKSKIKKYLGSNGYSSE
jgi:hypothetical protein